MSLSDHLPLQIFLLLFFLPSFDILLILTLLLISAENGFEVLTVN
jgi:hypothetical protein